MEIMSNTQAEVDLAEYLLNNKEELHKLCIPWNYSELIRKFGDAVIDDQVLTVLKLELFSITCVDYETISLIINKEFVIKILPDFFI